MKHLHVEDTVKIKLILTKVHFVDLHYITLLITFEVVFAKRFGIRKLEYLQIRNIVKLQKPLLTKILRCDIPIVLIEHAIIRP